MKNRNTGCEEFPNCFCVYFCRIFLVGCVSVRQSVSIRAVQTESCFCPLRPTRPITSLPNLLSRLSVSSCFLCPSCFPLPLYHSHLLSPGIQPFLPKSFSHSQPCAPCAASLFIPHLGKQLLFCSALFALGRDSWELK